MAKDQIPNTKPVNFEEYVVWTDRCAPTQGTILLGSDAGWSLWRGRTGDSKTSRLVFGHGPSDHEWMFVIMILKYQYRFNLSTS
jgi:hypothetical protein